MKPDAARGNRRVPARRKRAQGERVGQTLPPPFRDGDFDPVEFAEFLSADEGPIPPDPGFKKRLRDRLWGIVRERAERRSRGRRTPSRPTLRD